MDFNVLNHELLRDDYTIEEATALQDKWRVHKEKMELTESHFVEITDINLIAGVDISFPKELEPKWGIACAVLWDYEKKEMTAHEFIKGSLHFPYKAGYLGFRENRLIAESILNLPQKPDLIMCDGHGLIHPRCFGEAVHLGLALDIPSFGVAKNPFIGRSSWKDLDRKKGERTFVLAENESELEEAGDNVLGEAICLTDNCKPVFLSVGYKITLKVATEIALNCSTIHRQPEPILLADNLSQQELSKEK
ncbi:MAG: endonuclease V [Promethearchaeota archaeon]